MIQLWKTDGEFYAVEVQPGDTLQVVWAMEVDASDAPHLLQEGLVHNCLDSLGIEGSEEAGEALMRLDSEGLIEEKHNLE